MANHASAKKRIRQTIKRTERNKHLRTTVRTLVKRVRTAVAESDKDTAKEALKAAVAKIDSAVSKGIYHRRTGSRYIGRLNTQVDSI